MNKSNFLTPASAARRYHPVALVPVSAKDRDMLLQSLSATMLEDARLLRSLDPVLSDSLCSRLVLSISDAQKMIRTLNALPLGARL